MRPNVQSHPVVGVMLLLTFSMSAPRQLVSQEPVYRAHPSTQSPAHLVTPERLEEIKEEVSNWGRWTDQRGTLNLITPQKIAQAASLVRDGIIVSLEMTPWGRGGMDAGAFGETTHRMSFVNPDGTITRALDWVGFATHDGLHSHMDALCHYATEVNGERVVLNGTPQNLTGAGCGNFGIDRMGPGVVTRAVLFDMPRLRGVEWLEPSTPIYVEDLEAWEACAGVKIGSGDAMILRTGRWAKRDAEGPWMFARGGAGLHASVIPWLKERGVALMVADAITDVKPSGVAGVNQPFHDVVIPFMGLPLVDNGYTEDVAETAARLNRWEFMMSYGIMSIFQGTASPFTALAIF